MPHDDPSKSRRKSKKSKGKDRAHSHHDQPAFPTTRRDSVSSSTIYGGQTGGVLYDDEQASMGTYTQATTSAPFPNPLNKTHNFGIQATPGPAQYAQGVHSFWDATVPGSATGENMATAFGSWLDGRAADARATLTREDDYTNHMRDVDVPTQSAVTNQVFSQATEFLPLLRTAVDQSGDPEAVTRFICFAETLRTLSDELRYERFLRDEMTNAQGRATDAAWKGWKMTRRGASLADGHASLDDARALWRSHEDDKATNSQDLLTDEEGEWDSMMRAIGDTPTEDILLSFRA
ncbi:hypothetical protein L198_01214 [Cryptococcus wingfieldii CBS 7118]|uniref:Uncharacterized protein n=1 Tax=Cryptococcus wingfieldii CBS 7118 TaxID=1295528 RepID=A0A1E3K483_9TREE|nr:hypothetical protein L198_01214 [Cryptococcus wingfieldii CBS 7118]ODO07633.1 hypothetical protein L198_01214 [Cryptococcus wingfieldii CBS 7118]